MGEGEFTPSIRIAQLWRYPIKSLLGERLPSLSLVGDGVDGDRLWGILDRGDGRILTARREPRLLFAASRIGTGDVALIRAQSARQPPAGRAPCRHLVEAQPRCSRKRASIGH